MITDLFAEASEDVNVCHGIFYLKESPKSLQMILEAKHCKYKALQYKDSDGMYVGGRKYNWDKIRPFLEIK